MEELITVQVQLIQVPDEELEKYDLVIENTKNTKFQKAWIKSKEEFIRTKMRSKYLFQIYYKDRGTTIPGRPDIKFVEQWVANPTNHILLKIKSFDDDTFTPLLDDKDQLQLEFKPTETEI